MREGLENKPAGGLAAVRHDAALMAELTALAVAAGALELRLFGKCTAELKADGSPVTIADQRAEDMILGGLARLLPGVPVVSEEAAGDGRIPAIGDDFILVDALDGTKEFVSGSGEFTLNIALIHKGVPVGGVVYAPALRRLWRTGAVAEAGVAEPHAMPRRIVRIKPICVRTPPAAGLVALASLRHSTPATEAFLARLPIAERRAAGSSVKFCLLAEGQADIYPRFAPTMEWDTAAGHAVLLAAGGEVYAPDGAPLRYGNASEGFRNPSFVAMTQPTWRRHLQG